MKLALIHVDDIPDQGTKILDFFGRELHVYKVNGKPRALVNTCMHFGGPLEYQGDKFVCQWHGAEYAFADGHCLSGPAPANSRLMFLSTRIEEGMLTYVWGE